MYQPWEIHPWKRGLPPVKRDSFLDKLPKITFDKEPCKHDSCTQCNGTGINQETGIRCVHMISCPCKKYSPYILKS